MIAARTRRISYSLDNLRGDAFGGVIAGISMLPITLVCSSMAGLDPAVGLFGAAVFGFATALFGGSLGMISGPSFSAAIIMGGVVSEYGAGFGVVMAVGVLAGLFSIALGLLRLGSFVLYIPHSVFSGFFTALGIIIAVPQAPRLFGAETARGSVIGAAQALPEAITGVNFDALAVSAISLGAAMLWRGRISRIVPSLFVALMVGTVAGILWFRGAPVIGDIPSDLPSVLIPQLPLNSVLGLIWPAFSIALLNAMMTLLAALMLDSITGGRHQPNRVLIGQGVGYLTAGLIGGLPGGSSAISYANARLGGRTLVAGLLAAAILAGAVLGLSVLLAQIPLAALSVILVKTGWDIIDWRFLKRLNRTSRYHVAVALTTISFSLFVDFTLGILVGLVISGLVNSRSLENIEVRQLMSVPLLDRQILEGEEWSPDTDPFAARVGLVRFPDCISVASARETIRLTGPDLAGHEIVIFDFSRTYFVDDTAAHVIAELINVAVVAQSKPCVISGLSDDIARNLAAMDVFTHIPQERIASDMAEATQIARRLLADS